MQGPSPLLGYNTNVRHAGKLYHIQTEDSGIRHPHVITHLFADGGRIIASKKTTYAEHVGAEDFQKTVKQLMRAQHKEMFIGLRDGVYDEDGADEAPAAPATPQVPVPPAAPVAVAPVVPVAPAEIHVDIEVPGPPSTPAPAPDFAALDAAAAAYGSTPGVPAAPAPPASTPSPGLYQSTQAAVEVAGRAKPERLPESIFGNDLLSEKSLDEVILSYLAEDLEDSGEG